MEKLILSANEMLLTESKLKYLLPLDYTAKIAQNMQIV